MRSRQPEAGVLVNGAEHQTWRDTVNSLHHALTTAQKERRSRDTLVNGEPAWVTHERNTMHGEVNRLRALHGLPPVPLDAVRAAEDQAVGHSDYTHKYALRCADLVHDL